MAATLILTTILIPWAGALIVWLVGDKRPRAQHALAVTAAVLAGISALMLIPYNTEKIALSLPIGGAFGDFTFAPDGLALLLACVATVVGSLAVLFSVNYMHGEKQLGRYYSMVLFFIGAMVGLVLSSNLLLMFAFWEITAVCSYVLISFYNDDPKAVAGGIKALIITQFGGVGLLGLAALSYAHVGSYDVQELIAGAGSIPQNILAIAAFGTLIAAASKSSLFPFQTWLPDAMEAPTPISALIHAATMVNAGIYLVARLFPAFEGVPGWTTAVICVGAISALLAGLMALVAMDLKRVLAYSTVSQLGYMMYALGTGGIFAGSFHLFSHAIFKALLFLAAGAVIHSIGTRELAKMGGLGKKMPLVRTVFVIGSLALAGLPILNGFWSKELILEAGLHGPIWAWIIMLFTAGLTAAYTFRVVYLVFYGEPRSELHVHPAGSAMKVSLVTLAGASFVSWLLVGPLSRMMSETMPFHALHELSLFEMIEEVCTAPATLIALLVIALGLATWHWRAKLRPLARYFRWVSVPARNSFGFDHLNQFIVTVTKGAAQALRVTQTGLLGWNVIGIFLGLAVILAIITAGA
jgi:NADH-quinone oxidoreductase subunit L